MGIKILIVEDQFIEANDLQTILKRAGHQVIGIAKSVEQATNLLKKEVPDMVLLDIFLRGPLSGIDLAYKLSARNIPFIYISANSNHSTLEAAKATNPYGFLIKPYREKDILLTLDIASYRHRHTIDLMQRQEKWLNSLLENILSGSDSQENRLLQLINALKTFVNFDFIAIDTHLKNKGLKSAFAFKRLDYNEYQRIDGVDVMEKTNSSNKELEDFRLKFLQQHAMVVLNESEFIDAVNRNKTAVLLAQCYEIQSCLLMPLTAEDDSEMFISFYSLLPNTFQNGHLELLCPLKPKISAILDLIRGRKNETSKGIVPSHKNLERPEETVSSIEGIIGKSPKLLQVLDQVTQVAPFNTTVLVSGETGVGKEGIVSAIHQLSPRKSKPLVKINCAAIPLGLIESELFGHEKGAFTSASERRIGKFEQAQGGSIFLDEIGEIPIEVQSKLLRVLQEKELERIGGRTTIKIDVRIIAATNKNLYKAVAEGKFRIDLYYRLHVFPITVPALRDRREDIPLLVRHFLQVNAALANDKAKTLTNEMNRKLLNYSWPGNIRELQHVIERSVVMARGPAISSIEFPDHPLPEGDTEHPARNKFQTIEEIEKAHIVAALKASNGKVSGKGGAAEILNIPATTLSSKMKKFGIVWKFLYT